MGQNKDILFRYPGDACERTEIRRKTFAEFHERIQSYASAITFLQERLSHIGASLSERRSLGRSEYAGMIACVITLSEYLKRYYEKIEQPVNLPSAVISFPLPLVIALKRANRQVTQVSSFLGGHCVATEIDFDSLTQLEGLQYELEKLCKACEDVVFGTRFVLHQARFQERAMVSFISHR